MIFVDAHCHLGSRQFDNDREEVISSMLTNHVEKAIIICCSEHDLVEGKKLRDSNNGFKLACSIHPQALENDSSSQRLADLRRAVINSRADMIGEIGLDYRSHPHTKEIQKLFFDAQMEMAVEFGLPVDVHLRKASLDTLETLKRYPVKGIIHSYSGSAEMADLFIKLGYYISFGASVLFPGSKKPAHVIQHIPLDRLLIETDAPYQSPVKGYRHEPSDVKAIYQKISEILDMDLEDLMKQVEQNFDKVFE